MMDDKYIWHPLAMPPVKVPLMVRQNLSEADEAIARVVTRLKIDDPDLISEIFPDEKQAVLVQLENKP